MNGSKSNYWCKFCNIRFESAMDIVNHVCKEKVKSEHLWGNRVGSNRSKW